MKIENAPNELTSEQDCLVLVEESLKHDDISHGGTGNSGDAIDEGTIIEAAFAELGEIKEQVSRFISRATLEW